MIMKARRFRWERVLLATVAVYVAIVLLITIATTAYGVLLGMQAQGAPDQEKITGFARMHGATYAPWLGLMVTFLAALWAARRTALPVIHGLLVGLLVNVIGFFTGTELTIMGILVAILTVAAGGLGGFLSAGTQVGPAEGTV